MSQRVISSDLNKMSRFLVIIAVFSWVSCGDLKKSDLNLVKVDKSSPLYTYAWTSYQIHNDSGIAVASGFKYTLNGHLKYEVRDSLLLILPLDTSEIKIQVSSINKDEKSPVYSIRPTHNPDIHKEWDTLEQGETPTPLTHEEFIAFRTFSNYMMLGRTVPEFTLQTPYDQTITQDVFAGKVTLLNFWFNPCLPCIAEIPALNHIKSTYEGDEKVQFISFFKDSIFKSKNDQLLFQTSAISTNKENMKPQSFDFGFLHVMNAEEVSGNFNVTGYPVNMVIDQNAVIRDVFSGAAVSGDNESLIRRIEDSIERLKALANFP